MEPAGPKRKSWKRRLLWAAVATPLLLGVLAAWQLERLRAEASSHIAASLAAAFGAQAEVGEVQLDLVHAGLVARDVKVRDATRVLFSAPELIGRPALGPLLRGRLEVKSLTLPAASVQLTSDDLAKLTHGTGAALRALFIADLSLALDLEARGNVSVQHAKLELSSELGDGSRFELTSPSAGWVAASGGGRASARLRARGRWSERIPVLAAAEGGSGKLELEALQLGAGPPSRVAVDWRYREQTWTLTSDLEQGGEALAVNAELSAANVKLELRPHGVSLDRLLRLASASAITADGVVDGRIDLSGTIIPLALTGVYELAATGLHVQPNQPAAQPFAPVVDLPQLTAAGHIDLSASGVRLDSLQLELGASRATAAFGAKQLGVPSNQPPSDPLARVAPPAGALALDPSRLAGSAALSAFGEVSVDLRSDAFDLSDLGLVWGYKLEGRGAVELHVQLGRADSATATAKLALVDAAVSGRQLGRVNANLALDPSTGRLTLEHADVNSPERQFVADGSVLQFNSAGLAQAEAKLRSSRLPLRELYRVLGAADDPILAQLQGTAAGTAELTLAANGGSAALTLSLALALTNIDLSGYPFDRGKVNAKITIPDRTRGLAAGTLSLAQLSLGAAAGTLELTGEIRSGKLDMQLGLHALPLERAPWLRTRSKSFLTGLIDGRGTLGGDAQSSRADLKLGLEGLRLLGEPLGRIQLAALLRSGATADLDPTTCRESRNLLASPAFRGGSAWLFCGDGLDSHLHVDLALGNASARPIRGRLALTSLSLAPFLRDLQPSAADPHGLGSLTAALELTGGGLADPERLSGVLHVDKLALGASDARLENVAPFELRSRDGALELAAATLKGVTQHFVLSAAGTLGKGGKLTADGQIEARMFARDAEPLVKVFGNAGVHLEWAPFAQPALRGRIELQELAVRGPGTLSARRLRGALALSGDRLKLEGVEAEVGGGSIALSGQLQIDGLRPTGYDLAIESKRVSIEPEPLVQLELDASTKLVWRGAAALPELSGNVVVRHLAYGKPLHLEALAAMNRARSGAAARDRLKLDLTIEQREPLRVRNMLLDGELAITGAAHSLRVVGTDQRFGVLGDLAVTRGRISFQGNQFHFTRGEIELRDPARVAPHFEVRAVADQPRRPDTSVVLSAEGTRDAFEVAVQCDAGAAAVDAPPFKCSYARDRMACDDFDRLVAQWTCPTKIGTGATTRR